MLDRRNLGSDFATALRTTLAVLPTALALAFASGVPAGLGLVTAVVAGAVTALLGSTPFVVVGPVALLALLVGTTYGTFGMAGVVAMTLGVGLLQLLVGALRGAHWLRAVPASVVGGFAAGVGATLVVAEVPHLLGLPAADSKHLIDVVIHALDYLEHVKPSEALVAAIALGVAVAVPRWLPLWPGRFLALATATVAAELMHLRVATLEGVSAALPPPRLVDFPRGDLVGLAGATLLTFVLASVHSTVATEALTARLGVDRRDANGDLVGLGLANLATGFFGAFPAAVSPSLSELHTHGGVRSRRATFLVAVLVAFAALVPAWLGRVPVAALAALVVVVAARLVDVRDWKATLARSKSDGVVYAATFFLVLLVDLFVGVQLGILAALAVVAIRLGRLDVLFFSNAKRGPYRIHVDGALTFLSAERVAALQSKLAGLDRARGAILDLVDVTLVDGAGATALRDLVSRLKDRGWEVALLGLNADCRKQLESVDATGALRTSFAATEADAQALLRSRAGDSAENADARLRAGVAAFRARHAPRLEPLFDELAAGQRPHTLFITCADSRIQPTLITSTDPGELFLIRNVGNLVPPYAKDDLSPAEHAAVEYAIVALGVTQIVVCGHSACGAMKAIVSGAVPDALDSVRRWIATAFRPEEIALLRAAGTPEEAAQRNAVLQLGHLLGHPLVAERVAAGTLRVSAWFYDIGAGEILEHDGKDGRFHPLSR